MIPKLLIVAVLAAIILALGVGLVSMMKGQKKNMARALTIRIALSVGLFALLMLGYFAGIIKPHGIYPDAPTNQDARQTLE